MDEQSRWRGRIFEMGNTMGECGSVRMKKKESIQERKEWE